MLALTYDTDRQPLRVVAALVAGGVEPKFMALAVSQLVVATMWQVGLRELRRTCSASV